MLVLIGFTIILIGLLHLYLNGAYKYWKNKGVPYPPPTPIVGNIGSSLIIRKHLALIYDDMYNNFKECAYVGFYKLTKPAILVRSVELVKDVTTKEFSSFHDNDLDIDEKTEPLFGTNPFALKGDKWKTIRSKIITAITSGKIKQMFSFMSNISQNLVKYLNNEPNASGAEGLEAKELCCKFTTDVVAACAFGLDGKSFVDPNSEFRTIGKKIFNPGFIDSIKGVIIFLLPQVAKIFKLSFIPKDVTNWFIGTLQQTIKYREENNVVRNDYLDLMLSLKTKPGDYQFNDMDVMAQSMTFFSDGMETSGAALSFTLYEIAKNKHVQENLRNEIKKVLAKHNGELVFEAIQEMEYLDMVISEALRIYPPASFLFKRCTKQFTLPPPKGEGTGPHVVIHPEMSVIIPVYSIHNDPQYYPDPEKFIPERFTEESKKNRPKGAYLPFGDGPRQCLGFRFALAQIKAAVVATVQNFEISVNSKTNPEMEIDPVQFILAKKGGIWLNFNKLSK